MPATTTKTVAPSGPETMFASKSLREHWIRGGVGLVLAVAAFSLTGPVGPVSLLLLVPAGLSWRGCISCWALGLAQTRSLSDARTGCDSCVE